MTLLTTGLFREIIGKFIHSTICYSCIFETSRLLRLFMLHSSKGANRKGETFCLLLSLDLRG